VKPGDKILVEVDKDGQAVFVINGKKEQEQKEKEKKEKK
jgi:hypothetical protein